jgi:hypothetical protein
MSPTAVIGDFLPVAQWAFNVRFASHSSQWPIWDAPRYLTTMIGAQE